MFMNKQNFLWVAAVGSILLAIACTPQTALAGHGYWDLFSVNLTPNGLYWNQVNGGTGALGDPLVSPDPNGNPVIDNATVLGGVAYGFGGHDWGTGTLEPTAVAGNSIQLMGATSYYLSIVLDSATNPHADNLYPSWGTISSISVQPWNNVQGAWDPAIAPNWNLSPYDPNGLAIMPNPTTVKLAPSDFGDGEGPWAPGGGDGLQTSAIYGVGAQLPTPAAGYRVTFDTNLKTWDSYSLTSGGGGGGGQYTPTQEGCVEHPENKLPTVKQVPGKEFSDEVDKNAAWVPDALQNLAFDGAGNIADTFDYSGSATMGNSSPNENDQVDALANSNDDYFWPAAQDQVPIVVSFAPAPAGVSAPSDIFYQMAQAPDTTGVWCPAKQVVSAPPGPPDNVDGLELYGPKNMDAAMGGDDANMFSLLGDPGSGAFPGGVAVWQYNSMMHRSLPYITTAALKAAIGIGDDLKYPEQDIDLDALMVYESEAKWEGEEYGFEFGYDYTGNGPPDSIMFSLRENQSIGGSFDGGEIWVWTFGGPAVFLVHGGEVWNTAHMVGADFGVGTEEIDALEAVSIPEPATLLLLLAGALCLMGRRLWRKR